MQKIKAPVLNEGIQFKKLDLHVHTYRSYGDFERDGVDDQHLAQIADEICEEAQKKGLDGIAITDHNSGEAVNEIKAASKRAGGKLAIIPGAEVDVFEGFHVICLFPNEATSTQIKEWLIKLGVESGNIGKTHFSPSKSTSIQAVRELMDGVGGLLIAAHADSSSQGLFATKKSSGSKHINSLMDTAKFDAIETKNLQRLKREYSQFLNGYAIHQASDNHIVRADGIDGKHHPAAIGTLFTWFKLDEISVDGLRQCCIDPDVRIKQMDEWKPEMIAGAPRILSLQIKGGEFFLDGQTFVFNTDINSFLGGKGAGKSLILEYLRFGLDDLADDEFILCDATGKLIKTLGTGGKVIIKIQSERGDTYVITREFDVKKISDAVTKRNQKITPDLCDRILSESPIEVTMEDGAAKPNIDVGQLFPVVAYSQTEIFTLARDKRSQLALLDKYINKTEFLTNQNTLEQKLQKNDSDILKSLQAKWKLPQIIKVHTTLKEKLNAKTKQAKNPKYEKSSKIKGSYDVAQGVITALFEIKNGAVDSLEHQKLILETEIASYDSKEKNTAKTKLVGLLKLVNAFIRQEQDYEKKVFATQIKIDVEAEIFKKQYKKFLDKNSIKITIEEHDEVRQALEQVQKTEGLAKKYDGLFNEREDLLNQLEKLRSAFAKLRKEKYQELTEKSANRLRLNLIEEDDKQQFRDKLKGLLSGSGNKVESFIDNFIVRNSPRQFVNKVLADRIEELRKDIGQKTQVDCDRMVAHLKGKAADLLSLEYQWVYVDEPKIELNVKNDDKDADEYKELDQLSVGQKSTALLVISLLEGNYPILIDQPEDALDLKSVIQDVSERLRQYKTKRQFIITTHNSSVAVSSDSDKYFVLEPDGDIGRLLFSGAIDTKAIREQVINYLEGGSTSYDLKRKKYRKS